MSLSHPKRVAIVGGGLTGISSFWALQHSGHDVHLFEATPALGGHIKKLSFEYNGNQVEVNTELPSFDPEACPNLISLLCYLGIPTTAIPFSFGVSDGISTLKWYNSIFKSVVLHPQVLGSVETFRLLLDVICLRYLATNALADESQVSGSENAKCLTSTHSYLPEEGYSDSFRDKYLAPLLSMLWRTNAGRFLSRFPIQALVSCLSYHRLIHDGKAIPKWWRIDSGVEELIEIMCRNFPQDKVHVLSRVNGVARNCKDQYLLVTSDGQESLFDHIIFTVDGHEILRILGPTMSMDEKKILQGLSVTKNIAVLHSEQPSTSHTDLFPLSCNYIIAPNDQYQRNLAPPKACIQYNINDLQDIPASIFGRVHITLNPLTPVHPSLVQGIWEFTEPEPCLASLQAQNLLPLIQNKRGLSYGFFWTGRGVLEDTLTSGLRLAIEGLGAEVPFDVKLHPHPLDPTRPSFQGGRIRDILIRTLLHVFRIFVLVLEIILILLGRFQTPGSKLRARLNLSRAIKPA